MLLLEKFLVANIVVKMAPWWPNYPVRPIEKPARKREKERKGCNTAFESISDRTKALCSPLSSFNFLLRFFYLPVHLDAISDAMGDDLP